MGILENPRHEKYAQGIAAGETKDRAYQLAGFKPNRGNATRVAARPEIKARVAELVEQAAANASKTLADVVKEYERIAFTGMSRFIKVDADGNPRIDLTDCEESDLDLLSEASTISKRVQGEDKDKAPDEILTVKIKPVDRLKALEKLASYLGMGDTAAVQSTDRLTDAIIAIGKRGSVAPMRKPKFEDKS